MKELSGWGRYPVVRGHERLSEDLEASSRGASLMRGLGRSYGDASLPRAEGACVASSRRADRLLSFDADSAVLRAEAGLSLAEVQRLSLPRGFSAPIYPGTQHVTLGGMVASDVHGKNHHVAGTFGAHVHALRMRVADGRVLEVTEASEPELFRATLGGMGLTGQILEVEFSLERIPSPWVYCENERVGDLDALIGTLRAASATWPFTMAWVDCLKRGQAMGRGIVSRGRWAQPGEAPAAPPPRRRGIPVPFTFPNLALSAPAMRVFNTAWYRKPLRQGVSHPGPFLYPLDAFTDWNRIYGRRGLVQYQCVIPVEGGTGFVRRFFETLTARGGSSFLTVVKDCGDQGKGMLSFPRPGISVALDVPMRGAATQALIDALNEVVIESGGRIYLTKDALTRPEHFRAMEPRLDAWLEVRRKWDPDGVLASAQSVRLFGDAR